MHVRCQGDRGAGLVSTFAGFLVFLVFLLFACQTLLGLFARSSVSAAAFDGARSVADRGILPPDELDQAQAEAESRMRQLLGQAGAQSSFDWTGTNGDWVQVQVRVPAPRLGWPGFTTSPAPLERSARVRVEDLR